MHSLESGFRETRNKQKRQVQNNKGFKNKRQESHATIPANRIIEPQTVHRKWGTATEREKSRKVNETMVCRDQRRVIKE